MLTHTHTFTHTHRLMSCEDVPEMTSLAFMLAVRNLLALLVQKYKCCEDVPEMTSLAFMLAVCMYVDTHTHTHT